jgi:hypothetical protein
MAAGLEPVMKISSITIDKNINNNYSCMENKERSIISVHGNLRT